MVGPRRRRAIRSLNDATRHDAGLDQPAVAYNIFRALATAAGQLGQLLTQTTRYLDHASAIGQLGHDLGEDPAHAIDAATIFLGDARSGTSPASDLDAAWQQPTPVIGRPTGPGKKDQS